MVTSTGKEERKHEPSYDLADVQGLAQCERVNFAGQQVLKDVDALGFSLADVCACLCKLSRELHFKESIRYPGLSWQDVYLISDSGSSSVTYELYIKLKVFGSEKCLIVHSFHEQGRQK